MSPQLCKHADHLIVQRNYGHRWVTCTECHTDFLPANGERVEPDWEAAMQVAYDEGVVLAGERHNGRGLTRVKLIVDAAVGGRLLVDPPKEERQ